MSGFHLERHLSRGIKPAVVSTSVLQLARPRKRTKNKSIGRLTTDGRNPRSYRFSARAADSLVAATVVAIKGRRLECNQPRNLMSSLDGFN
jgi:hypothetical protein